MSLLPGEPLQYAETHFKFKLPWSLLYRPWPEILVDAPFQFEPGASPILWIVVRDAHRFPTTIESIEIRINGGEIQKALTLNIEATEQFGFYPVEPFELGELKPGRYEIQCKVTAIREVKGKRCSKVFSRWNYPLLRPAPLKIHVLSEVVPKAPGFVAGEMHCHTHYSADHVEHGASPAVFRQAAKAIGLDFVNCTDHAYDFAYTTEDYTLEADSPLPRFEALKKEVTEANRTTTNGAIANDRMPLLIASEEVSVGNSKGENVHMTVLGPEGYLPGLGDCGRNWLSNRPTFKIEKILQMTRAHCFAAHPYQEMSGLERFVFRRGYWKSADLHATSSHGIRGIQFWNGIRDEGFKLGRQWWIEELGKENYVLPIGGNDAHGDLNDTAAVDLPLFSLKHSRDHVFGKVRTVVKLPAGDSSSKTCAEQGEITCELSRDVLHQAFAGDNCYITDGPALWWESNGCDEVTFHARSTADFGGGFRYIRIYGRRRLPNGKFAPKEELHLASQVAARPAADISVGFEYYGYLRAECETASGRFALTSAAVNPRK